MADPSADLEPGARVRVSALDPPGHSRVPRYVRGKVGTVLERIGEHLRPDQNARGGPAEREPVYTVAFPAGELFGAGDHEITVDLWCSSLEPADGGTS